jgi:indole-3-glycerol phosphate synthase
MDFLSEIIASRKVQVNDAQQQAPLEQMRESARQRRAYAKAHRFADAVRDDSHINIIAEFKRRSPSKGAIKQNADAATVARAYESAGAAAISVLTEEDYFAGSLDDLRAVGQAVSVPLLRKDFILDQYQVYESAAAGSDALLLIVAALDDEMLTRLRRITEDELGMDALIEVHTREELSRAEHAGAKIIGVNNRDLRTFQVSLETSVQLASIAPNGALMISESGIESAADIERLQSVGYCGFLIGEMLMRADDPGKLLKSFHVGGEPFQNPER